MPEEEMDANAVATASSAEAKTNDSSLKTETAPADAKSAQSEENDNSSQPFHKHPRFQELVEEKNELKNKLSEMERLLQEKFDKTTTPDPIEVARTRLEKLGVKREAAEELIETFKIVSDSKTQNLEKAAVKQEIDRWIEDFSRSHNDYESLEPQMYQVFTALPVRTQQMVASDPIGLQMLYDHVKQQGSDELVKKAKAEGIKEGYQKKQDKNSVSPTVGGSQKTPDTMSRKALAEMPQSEYNKLSAAKRKELWDAIHKQGEGD